MTPIIEPTIGRRVWYYPSDFDRGLTEHKPATMLQVRLQSGELLECRRADVSKVM
jgi:outer membrane protein assembly factor BamE (lipoprotein component of BamABCDE complex)